MDKTFAEHFYILILFTDDESGRKWQDEINYGFDRLVAYATEVDKRRKSTDSNNEDTKSEVIEPNDSSYESVPRNFMSMKFKARGGGVGVGVVSANSPYARTMPASKSISHVPSALASVASIEDLGQASKSPLPGENLPEHHFKKRYFVENSNKSPIHSSPSPRS